VTPLLTALRAFVAIYHEAHSLVEQNKDWDSRVSLVAADSGESINLQVRNGQVTAIGEPLQEVDLVITANENILLDILELRRDPNEPYMFGELTVQGDERHFMRLDYIVTMLCLV
jgi:putative sterol carrier protein